VLWLIYGGAGLVAGILGFLEIGVLEQFIATGEIAGMQIGPEVLLVLAVLLLVPLVIAFLARAL
jgi:hypothetical protein